MLNYFEIDPEKDKTDWEKLSDNRDINVFRVLGLRTEKDLDDRKRYTLDAEQLWLRMRNLTIRAIACAHYVSERHQAQLNDSNKDNNNGTNGTAVTQPNLVEILGDLLAQLAEISKLIRTSTVEPITVSINEALKSCQTRANEQLLS